MMDAGGASQRDHILEAARQLGKTPEELGYPEFALDDEDPLIPDEGLYLWNFFQELSSGRINSGFGPTALSWSDIEAWVCLTSTPLSPYEVLTIRSMDAVFLSAHANESERHNKSKSKQ
uniref:phage tail assembly chaperone n=1 Tax=uncultured Bilophila sp. TaxID=529385 RepID=UPI0025D1581F|nr:hypothetical protein [uncultured Bilophila sp.]